MSNNKDVPQANHSESEEIEEELIKDESGKTIRKVNMPQKKKFRMRAHINPMNEIHIPVPKNPNYAQWHQHFPSYFDMPNNNDD